MAFFAEMEKLTVKLIQNCKGPLIVKRILNEKNKVGELTHSNFKIYKAIVNKTV